MKTTMPEPEFRYASGEDEDGYFTYLNAYTESQLRAAMEAAYNEAITEIRTIACGYLTKESYGLFWDELEELKEQTP